VKTIGEINLRDCNEETLIENAVSNCSRRRLSVPVLSFDLLYKKV